MDVDVACLTRRRYQPRIGHRPAGEVATRQKLQVDARPKSAWHRLAMARARCRQQALEIGAVRVVAVEAVFPDRRVLEQERPTLVRMAAIAHVVDAIGLEQRIRRRAVRIVAIDAAHLSFRQRHVRAHMELRARDLVAGEAGFVDQLSRAVRPLRCGSWSSDLWQSLQASLLSS